ncbi:MAG TPA: twin-arginine translocase TatA/TatE family subunit [Firmicutes bacterium]|nr:twin-arginine translocase TatA/TatE family subunit [Bacillota bacterium]
MRLGVLEIVLLLIVFLLFCGPKKLTAIVRACGTGIREMRNAAKNNSPP